VTPLARFTRFGEAFERRDREAWDAEAAPDITMVPIPGWPDPGPFTGRDAAWAFMVGTEEPFDEVVYDGFSELEENGDIVVARAERKMRPRGAPDLVEVSLFMVATVTDAGTSRVESFLDRDQARAVAGLA
jgi:ketosteroid isomerase-like protein